MGLQAKKYFIYGQRGTKTLNSHVSGLIGTMFVMMCVGPPAHPPAPTPLPTPHVASAMPVSLQLSVRGGPQAGAPAPQPVWPRLLFPFLAWR